MNIEVLLLDWNVVSDEEVCKRVRTAKDDLNDLKCCKRLLNGLWYFNRKCRKSVVSILKVIIVSAKANALRQSQLTIKACKPELMNTNIQIGGDM